MLGWRDVPTDDSTVGDSARRAGRRSRTVSSARERTATAAAAIRSRAFERKLYVIRKRVEHEIDSLDLSERKLFYVVSLSSAR